MDLSIIIVNWNTRDLLAQCLESVASERLSVTGEQLSVNSEQSSVIGERLAGDERRLLRAEVFVVDNASTDGSAAMVRERFPWVTLIENAENVGFAQANNQAIARCQAGLVLLLNSDAELRPGALETLVSFMDGHPGAGAAGARLLNADGALQPSCHPMLTPWREFLRLIFLDRLMPSATYDMSRWSVDTPRLVEVIKGACLMLRRGALDQVGRLDARYFMYTEEVDLCYRLGRAGWQLYWVPQAQAVHYGERSTRQIADTMYIQLYRSKAQFYRKVGGEPYAGLFKTLVGLAYAPRLVVAAADALVRPGRLPRARIFGRLLAELPGM